MRYRDRLTLTLLLLATLFVLSTVEDSAQARQQCGLPEPAATELASVIYWTELALQFERESWQQTAEWYATDDSVTGAGRHIGNVMTQLERLADGVDSSEWQAIGVKRGNK